MQRFSLGSLAQLGSMALVTLHVALDVGARGNDGIANFLGVLQRLFGQGRGDAATAQCIGHKCAIDIQGLFPQIHIGQVGTMTVHIGLELMTSLVMVDGQRLAHHYSSRVWNSDPYLTDVFPAKEQLRHPVPESTPRRATPISRNRARTNSRHNWQKCSRFARHHAGWQVLLWITQETARPKGLAAIGSLNIAGC